MDRLGLSFDHPGYLSLLLFLPVMWYFSFRSLAALGNARRILVILLRSIVFTVFVLALANVQFLRTSDRMAVIYLLDQSESIPAAKRQWMLNYVVQDVKEHRRPGRNDLAGVIVFGRDALIEVPPFDDDIPNVGRIEAQLGNTDATNLESALQLAQASFPEGSVKRIVIVTDGNENIGNARSVAPQLARNGIGIDVVPVTLNARAEIVVEKVSIPADIRIGQPSNINIVLQNYSETLTIPGKVRITQHLGPNETLIVPETAVALPPGKTVLRFPHAIDAPAPYRFRATFTADNPADDHLSQNNTASAFTHVQGKGRILLIENFENPGEFDFLVQRLRENKIETDIMPSNQLFTSLSELQAYDSVILANVPRASAVEGDEIDSNQVAAFSDDQIRMLVRNTEQFGSGLVMLGGANSFGAGGWANTELEKAMPVDFTIKNAKVQAVGALVCLMHASEMAQGNHWQKVVAREAIKALGPMDYCGLIHWDFGGDEWLWNERGNGILRVNRRRRKMLSQLNGMSPGDMPAFDPAMQMALTGFNKVQASMKLMIIISDGDPQPPRPGTINKFKQAGIKISTVAVGTHGPAGSVPLRRIAAQTGGKYYKATNPKALPRIYQREVRRIARPLIFEPPGGVTPQPAAGTRHEILQGIDTSTIPPIEGFMLTTIKENPLVEVALTSPRPQPKNGTILAAWTYKAGRTVAFTTDAGKKWTSSWTDWNNYDKLFTQMVRWSMRPVNEDHHYSVATDIKDGRVRVAVTAFDNDSGEFINGRNMVVRTVSPALAASEIKMRQIAPGRYVAEFPAPQAGSYHLAVTPRPGDGVLLSGIDVPYSSEYRERETNRALLGALASTKPNSGQAGKIIDGSFNKKGIRELLNTDTYRSTLAPAVRSQDAWFLFVFLGASVFLVDVFVRRVAVGRDWIAPTLLFIRQKLLRNVREASVDATIERLRNRKEKLQSEIDLRRAATRFEPASDTEPDLPDDAPDLDSLRKPATKRRPEAHQPSSSAGGVTTAEQTNDMDYTARLLAAKKHAWKNKPPE